MLLTDASVQVSVSHRFTEHNLVKSTVLVFLFDSPSQLVTVRNHSSFLLPHTFLLPGLTFLTYSKQNQQAQTYLSHYHSKEAVSVMSFLLFFLTSPIFCHHCLMTSDISICKSTFLYLEKQ